MNIKPYILPLCLLTATPVMAQLHESVNVEGTYLKDILHPERINQLPRLSLFPIGETPLNYASQGVAAEFTPLSPTIAATAWGANRDAEKRLGYVDLSMGSYLNSDLYFGVGLIRQSDQRLDLRLQHNSTSLWHPFGDITDPRKSYAENLGLSYAHKFEYMGLLTASAQYHLGYFNYFGINPEIAGINVYDNPYTFPTQTINDAAVRVGWQSAADGDWPVDWYATADVRYFAFRTATRETDLNLAGGVTKLFEDKGRLGIDASLNTLIYSEARNGDHPDNYATLSLSPFYKWQRNQLSLRVGANLDLAFNADGSETGKHYGAFHASPDIRFDVTSKNVGFYIHLLGGTELHTLAAMAQLDPYCNPHLASTQPIYTPFDANIGVELTPFRGFTAALNFQYKASNNVPMEGWYMTMLNYGTTPLPGLDIPAGIKPEYGTGLERYNLSGFGAQLKLAYKPSRVFYIHANGSYTPQHDKTGIFNGLDRPRWTADAGFEVAPVKQITFGADFEYRGVRRIYTGYFDPDTPVLTPGGAKPEANPKPKMEVTSMRLPDIYCLSAHAVWNVTSDFSLRVEANNLLNRRNVLLPMVPTEGVCFKGGLQWLF